MNKEEKEAIEELKKFSNLIIEGGIPNSFIVNKLKITFNLIDKQQKDLENLKEVERQICNEELITKHRYQHILKENEKLKQDNYNLDRENQLKFEKIIKENEYLKKILDLKILILNFIPQTIHEVEFKTKLIKIIGETKDEE